MLADSVSGQAGELAAALAGQVGGQERPGGGRRAGQVGRGGDLPRTVGVLSRVISLTRSLRPRGLGRARCLVAVASPAMRLVIESDGVTMAPLRPAATFGRS